MHVAKRSFGCRIFTLNYFCPSKVDLGDGSASANHLGQNTCHDTQDKIQIAGLNPDLVLHSIVLVAVADLVQLCMVYPWCKCMKAFAILIMSDCYQLTVGGKICFIVIH